MPPKIACTVIAIAVTPAVVAILFGIWAEVVWGHENGELAYFFGAYLFGFPLSVIAMAILQVFEFLRLWHFILAGLTAGLVGGFIFIAHWPEARPAFLIIGPITGAVAWMISEWLPPQLEDK